MSHKRKEKGLVTSKQTKESKITKQKQLGRAVRSRKTQNQAVVKSGQKKENQGTAAKDIEKKQETHFMYVLTCSDKSLYTGYTNNLEKRLATHNAGKGAKYTRARLPVELFYYETFSSKQEAMSAEALFKKKSRQAKLTYIAEQGNDLDSSTK